jgi:quinol-cytochrome oxidoreductase complex cytochrome b subunit
MAGGTERHTSSGSFWPFDPRESQHYHSFEALEHNVEVGKILGRFGFWFSPSFGGIPLLHRLYSVHVTILPSLFALIVLVHLMLVKRHGMAPSPFRKGPLPEPAARFSRHLAHLGAFSLVLIGIVVLLALLAPPPHGPAPVGGIEITKPPWPLLWIYPVENWVGISGILWATVAIFLALLVVPFVDPSNERDPRRRLWVVIPAAVVVLTITGLIVYAAVQPVSSHIGG